MVTMSCLLPSEKIGELSSGLMVGDFLGEKMNIQIMEPVFGVFVLESDTKTAKEIDAIAEIRRQSRKELMLDIVTRGCIELISETLRKET